MASAGGAARDTPVPPRDLGRKRGVHVAKAPQRVGIRAGFQGCSRGESFMRRSHATKRTLGSIRPSAPWVRTPMRWFRQPRLFTRALLALAAAWLLATQATVPAPLSAAAEAHLRANATDAVAAERCDADGGRKHDPSRGCHACCPACPADADHPLASNLSSGQLRAPARGSDQIANRPSSRTDGRPLGWRGGWSSRAPPSFS